MSGLNKIKSQIMDEARSLAEEKIAEAKLTADQIIEQAQKEAEESEKEMLFKAEAQEKKQQEKTTSFIDLQKRTKILEAKQEVISEVLKKAYEALENLSGEEYFAALLRLVEKYALPEAGEILFGKADLGRLPEGFGDKIGEIAKAKGGELRISEKEGAIKNGFILVYGGIEENCTLKALFDARWEELSDKVHRLLFA